MSALAASSDSALLAAARWIDELVQGPLVTSLAVLAIAAIGLMMLGGRLPVRRGLVAVLGCFILFGAPMIARGIVGAVPPTRDADRSLSAIPVITPGPAFAPPPPQAPPPNADPYAGASVIR